MSDLFFVTVKLFGFFTQSLNILLILLLVSVAAGVLGARSLRMAASLVALAWLVLLGVIPIWDVLLRPLEDRFEAPATLGGIRPDGLIVLGGPLDAGMVAETRGSVTLNASAERMTKALALARWYPEMRVVFSGYAGELFTKGASEADIARHFFEEQGLDQDRFTYENESRNTYESALITRQLVAPKPGETWLLVTSAAHMPRAMGVFREVGWPVVPIPVDYRTPKRDSWLQFNIALGSAKADLAIREWIALWVYYLTDRSSSPFPAP